MGFGDIITGGPVQRPFRTLLVNRNFSIRTYSEATVAAENFVSGRIFGNHQQPLQGSLRSIRPSRLYRGSRGKHHRSECEYIFASRNFAPRTSGGSLRTAMGIHRF